ncbi:EF-hand domain-containing protein [Polaromonas sp.]|uniref:EF-hand domain-containing protein n=1 Tax=Polaromonas sp. TaxID=1869339 RepID=UPI003267D463
MNFLPFTATPTTLTLRSTLSRTGGKLHRGTMMLVVATAAVLYATSGHAQAPEPAAAVPGPAATEPQPPASASTAPSGPKYAAKDLERAFNFMDKDNNGKVSRDEASNFRGVAKHFDEADTNKDNMLSREEFERAMNGPKPQ